MIVFDVTVSVYWDGATPTEERTNVKHISINRGMDANLIGIEIGTCTLTMVDTDGRYNPTNSASPIYGQTNKVRKVIVVDYQLDTGNFSTIFTGYTRRVISNGDRSRQEATIECADLIWLLGRIKPTIASSSTTVRQAIQSIVTQALDAPTLSYDGDGDTVTFSADGTVTGLQLIANLLTTDRGWFWIAADGTPTYYDRNALNRTTGSTVQSAISGTMSALAPGWDAESVRNRITVTRTGGTAQTASDATSIADYGTVDDTPITSAYLASDAAAASLASYLIKRKLDGIAPLRAVKLANRDTTIYRLMRRTDLSYRATVAETLGGTAFDGHVWRINHEITPAARTHFTTWGLIKREAFQPFLIGISTIGSTTDLISY